MALCILAVGRWIDRREWTTVSPWRFVGCSAGARFEFRAVSFVNDE